MTDPKPAISPARLAANQANALRSTGPKTEQGKAKSRLNGLVHGLRAELPILPGEDPEALRQRLDAWTRDLAPEGDVERHLVETAVQASWRMDRCRAVETAVLTQQIADVEESYEDRAIEEVERLIPEFGADPGILRQLRQSSLGCRWLLARWETLAARLDGVTALEGAGKDLALHLLGKSPGQIFDDPTVRQWTVMHLAATRAGGAIAIPDVRALLAPDRPEGMHVVEFERRVQGLIDAWPEAPTAHAFLTVAVRAAIADLTERAELLDVREERDRALAVRRAAFDESKEGGARLRYEMAHHRAYRGALRDLHAEQKRRLDRGASGWPDEERSTTGHAAPSEPTTGPLASPAVAPPVAPAPTEPKPVPAASPRRGVQAPTEPKLSPLHDPLRGLGGDLDAPFPWETAAPAVRAA